MLKALLKKQLFEINCGFFYDRKKGVARSKAASIGLIVLYGLLVVGVLGGVFTMLALSICGPLNEIGMGWLYFALFCLIAVALGVFGSVFSTYAGLYLAKDNDLLLSMPIPVRYILISRLLSVYLLGLMFTAVVLLPAILVYLIVTPFRLASLAGCIVLLALISIFVLFLSCLLGWVVAKISLKLKNRSFITVAVSVLFLGGYYFVYFKAREWIQALVANAAAYGAALHSKAYPVYLLGRVGEGDWLAMLVVGAVILLAFWLTWVVLSRSFLKIATATGKTARAVYREKTAHVRSVSSALLGKELKRFTSSPNYMLNCGMGILFLFVGAVAALIKGRDLSEVLTAILPSRTGCVPVLLCTAVCMLVSMVDVAAPSVSLEGKSLWLLQSLPVRPWQALRAKLRAQLLLGGVPAALCAICAAVVMTGSLPERLLSVAAALLFTLFMALLSLAAGTRWANTTWTTELTPIKQSASVMLALFGGWIASIALGGVYLFVGFRLGAAAYLGLACAVLAALSALLYLWLKRRGSARFAAL